MRCPTKNSCSKRAAAAENLGAGGDYDLEGDLGNRSPWRWWGDISRNLYVRQKEYEVLEPKGLAKYVQIFIEKAENSVNAPLW